MVEYNLWTGHLRDIIPTMNRSVARYTVLYRKIKIGITNNPESRFKAHLRDTNWDKMVVKYSTKSVKYINDLERILIDNHWDYITNQVRGGGGPNGSPPYYLYILILK